MKVITFDRSKNISYFGKCKLQSHIIDKCLNVKLLDKEPEETKTFTYSRIFICKNNFLCCMNQNTNNGAIFIFSTKGKCVQVFNTILKAKIHNPQPSVDVATNEDDAFKDNFFLPLMKAVQGGTDGIQDLRSILSDFVHSLDNDERSYYYNILVENLVVPSPRPQEEEVEGNDKQVVSPVHPHLPIDSAAVASPVHETPKRTFNSSEPSTSSAYSMRRRSNVNYKEVGIGSNRILRRKSNVSPYVKPVPRKSNVFPSAKPLPKKSDGESCFDEPSPQNSTNDVDFDVIEYLHDGKVNKKIIVFASNERKQYYEFTFNSKTTNYHCVQCFAQNKRTTIGRTIHDNGSHTFEFNTDEHICDPIDYSPGNQSSLIVKSPNFKFTKREVYGKMKPLLIVFDPVDKDICYKFGYDSYPRLFLCSGCKKLGRTVNARFIQHSGETSIELGRLQHICEPQKYIPENL
uniref:Uncharacterized protein n=1 Tax=Panagrolaimus davidi TaxID=227884 RepID=A0A914P8U6_9BILA